MTADQQMIRKMSLILTLVACALCRTKMCLQEMELCGYHTHVEDGCTKTELKDVC